MKGKKEEKALKAMIEAIESWVRGVMGLIRNILCYAEESARRFPGKTAFADEETACTYDELIKSARAVGTRLGKGR